MNAAIIALEQILPDRVGKIFDYGDPEDFERLWSFSGLPEDRLLIVWGRTAGDGDLWPIDASACLSPIDWAVAYAKHLAESSDGVGEVRLPQILVLDAAANRAPVPPSLEHFRTLNQRQLPWLRVPESPGLSDIKEWLAANPVPHDETSAQSLKRFLREIRLNITEMRSEGDYDRHAISNIVAPMVLLGNAWKSSRHSAALLELLRATCLCPKPAADQQGHADETTGSNPAPSAVTPPAPGSAKTNEDQRSLSVLLVDDQADHGWTEWLRACLPDAQVKALTDPNVLLDALEAQFRQADEANCGNKVKDLRFRFRLPGFDQADKPVLFLDLRLFSGRPKEERKFLQRIIWIIDDRGYTERDDLAWPSFSDVGEGFRAARAAVEREEAGFPLESAGHHEALTWMPRLMALVDMSLPIILFSSTGRRDLAEPFREYGNIITSFEKPRLTDFAALAEADAPHQASSSADAVLREAVSPAQKWLEGRKAAMRILKTNLTPLTLARKSFARKTHFEIYHDESGEVEKPYFRVMSLLAGFEADRAAEAYNKQFPVKFYGRDRLPKRAPIQDTSLEDFSGAEKNRWENDIWNTIERDAPPMIFSVAVRDRNTSDQGDPDSIFDPQGLDNINWDLLALMWESLLVDVLPSLLEGNSENEQFTICIYGATRDRAIRLAANNPKAAVTEGNKLLENLRAKWGIDLLWKSRIQDEQHLKVSFPDGQSQKLGVNRNYQGQGTSFTFLWKSLGEDSFWKLVSDVLFGRKDSDKFPWISKAIRDARGFTLEYRESAGDSGGAKHLHYIADVLGGVTEVDLLKETVDFNIEPFSDLAKRGVNCFRDRLLCILNANRLLDVGDCDAEAITAFDRLNHGHPVDIAYLALAERLQKQLWKLNGMDMRRVVAFADGDAAQWLGKNRIQAPARIAKRPSGTTDRADNRSGRSAGSTQSGSPKRTRQMPRKDPAASGGPAKWMLRRYESVTAYKSDGVSWHLRPGFRVRRAKSGKITVFADLSKVSKGDFEGREFKEPLKNSFQDNGDLIGEDWAPDTISPWSKATESSGADLNSAEPISAHSDSQGGELDPARRISNQGSGCRSIPVPNTVRFKGLPLDILNRCDEEGVKEAFRQVDSSWTVIRIIPLNAAFSVVVDVGESVDQLLTENAEGFEIFGRSCVVEQEIKRIVTRSDEAPEGPVSDPVE